jgi:hypothetical protein
MYESGVKRIIFSIYREDVDKHTSTPLYKSNQFKKYKEQIIANHKAYAKLCGADYELFTDVESKYDIIQFQKISIIKKLAQKYDEVLYLDFDVIINTHLSFFDHFDLNTICAYNIDTTIPDEVRGYRMKDDNWHPMDMYVKACCKNAMLLLDDINNSNLVINTGVIGVNKKSAQLIDFSKCYGVYHKAKEDNLYPTEINSKWKPNNEVYLTYIIERYNLPYTNIGLQWNFILDDTHRDISAGAYFYHVVNKNFGLILNA